jgi:hypothetical protein
MVFREPRTITVRMGRAKRTLVVPPMVGQPLMVSDGLGTDSQAALIILARAGIRPDLIMFADTGDEKGRTYAFIDVLRPWLKKVGFPDLTIVRKTSKLYRSLSENCLANSTLPSLAFGRKGCSQKWKVQVMEQWALQWEPAQFAWEAGMKCLKVIGYDAGPADCRRSKIAEDERYQYIYPLRDAGIKRVECVELIKSEGLMQPGKSACFMCPATKKPELVQLVNEEPALAALALKIEAKAEAFAGSERRPIKGFKSIKGLGRNWNWREYLKTCHPALLKRLLEEHDCGQEFMPAAMLNRRAREPVGAN